MLLQNMGKVIASLGKFGLGKRYCTDSRNKGFQLFPYNYNVMNVVIIVFIST